MTFEAWAESAGRWTERGGVGGIALTNHELSVRISMSGPGVRTWYRYIGQAVRDVTRIELRLRDGSIAVGSLLRDASIPVQLWIVFIDGQSPPSELRAFAGEKLIERFEIEDEWPLPRGNSVWGPVD